MLTAQANLHIDASTETVWTALAQFDQIDKWSKSVTAAEYVTNQTSGVGTARTLEIPQLGTVIETATEWQDGESIKYTINGFPSLFKSVQNRWSLEPFGDQTHVALTAEFAMVGGAVGTFLGKVLVVRRMQKVNLDLLIDFKKYVEKQYELTGYSRAK